MSWNEIYSVWAYGEMISDRARMDAYIAALRQHVNDDTVVLDIGTGTGIFALLASRYEARRVYAVEPSASIEVARQLAVANNLADRIEFIHDVTTRIDLPEPANVIISDLRGNLPLFENHCRTSADARRRLLAPGGKLIPKRDTIWAGLISGPEMYQRIVGPYVDNRYDLDLRIPLRFVTNEWRKAPKLTAEDVFMEPLCWAEIDYASWENPDFDNQLTWRAERDGTVNGVCVWFDTELADGIGFSNAPGRPESIYSRAFFPWSEPVDLVVGDEVVVRLVARLAGGDYTWHWNTRVIGRGQSKPKADFKQSTFHREPLSLARLRKRTSDHAPRLNEDGVIQGFILEAMATGRQLGDIASLVATRFPKRFPTWEAAFHEVAELSAKYSE